MRRLTPIRFLARALLGFAFIVLGWDAARQPGGRVQRVASVGVPQPELAVRANGALMVAAGTTLVLGIRPRLSAVALVASMVPTTLVGHPFWQEDDLRQRTGQRIHFLKNLSMIGGLLIVALGPDRPRNAARHSRARRLRSG